MDRAVIAARAANATTATTPGILSGAARSRAQTTSPAPARVTRISTTEVRPRVVPPAAPKATAANARPRRAVLAAEAWERDTAGERDTRKRDLRERGDALAERVQAAAQSHDRHGDQGQQERQREAVLGAGRVEQPVLAGGERVVTDLDLGLGRGAVDDLFQVALVLLGGRLRGSRAPGGRAAASGATTPVAAVLAGAADRRSDHVAAVAVLVEVGRELLLGLDQVRVRVLLVELPVLGAVLDHALVVGMGDRRGQRAQRREGDQRFDNAVHQRVPCQEGRAGAREGAPPEASNIDFTAP